MSFGVGNAGRSVQANLKLNGKRKTYFDRPLEYSDGSGNIYMKDLRTKMTIENLLIFRRKLQSQKRKTHIKRIVFAILFMCVLLTFLMYLNGGPL